MRPNSVESHELLETFLEHISHGNDNRLAKSFAIDDLRGRLWCADDSIFDDGDYSDSIEEVWADDFISVNCGSTKAVFEIDDIEDWVFKVPIFGMVSSYYDENGEGGIKYSQYDGAAEDVEFPCLTHSPKRCRKWDYCETEAIVTDYVERYAPHQQALIARTYYIGDIAKDIPLYVSERMPYGYCEGSKSITFGSDTYERSKRKAEFCHYGSEFSSEHVTMFIESYGYDAATQMLKLAEDMSLSDIYDANLGFDEEGRVHVIDYSGFAY